MRFPFFLRIGSWSVLVLCAYVGMGEGWAGSLSQKPQDGLLVGGPAFDPAKQFESKEGVTARAETGGIELVFPPGKGGAKGVFKPATGLWDLGDFLEVRVKLRNGGSRSLTPSVTVTSEKGVSDTVAAAKPIPSGETTEIVVPFIPAVVWKGQPGTGTTYASCDTSGVVLSLSGENGAERGTLVVESVRAVVPPLPALADWVGKRPPGDGEWTLTFAEEFDGNAVDRKKWNDTGFNWYDKLSHWSRENVIVRDGLAALRYEKKTGFQNDDPREKKGDYASGYLDTYGKWTQRYGYFEARMKLPRSPGLWPAFWLMPDRGENFGEQAKRATTADGAMEFDILEHLTRWGPYRYNVAMHWDGYEKEHKQTGTDHLYVVPDKDGYVAAGLLWTPGSAIFYCNGREVCRWEDPRISSVASEMLFTLPMGGWYNNALDDARLRADFTIDYVRVWQRKDLIAP